MRRLKGQITGSQGALRRPRATVFAAVLLAALARRGRARSACGAVRGWLVGWWWFAGRSVSASGVFWSQEPTVGVGQVPEDLPFPVGGVNPQSLRGSGAGLYSFAALSQVSRDSGRLAGYQP